MRAWADSWGLSWGYSWGQPDQVQPPDTHGGYCFVSDAVVTIAAATSAALVRARVEDAVLIEADAGGETIFAAGSDALVTIATASDS